MTARRLITQPSAHTLQRDNMRGFALLLVLVASYTVGLLRPAVADESDAVGAVASAAPSNAPDAICNALAAAAQENDLPIDFFTRLIWQESRFDPTAVSRAGAQGVAQFMPATANSRGLDDPFDPIKSIAHSAKLLRDLRRELGNLGLAAAAYNAGPGRVRDWLAGRRGLPRETDADVRIATGQSPEEWARAKGAAAEIHFQHPLPCAQLGGLPTRSPA